MRLRYTYLLYSLLFCLLAISGCSRESSIKENVNLRNNHSVVFARTTPFENPQAFADSIANLSNPDSVIVPDTITVTINDTIHMMGFLRYNADKVYSYAWLVDSLGKDSSGKEINHRILVKSKNAEPFSWSYPREGVYSPLFVAVDWNSATDTAGADQFIRVINTIPELEVPKDTLWTKHKTPITFPIVARDSFGTLTSIKVDVDANGKKADFKEWKYQKVGTSDTLLITIPFDANYTDSLGNQKIYISVTDDDKNTKKDSVYLHFNQLPVLTLYTPKDGEILDSTKQQVLTYQAVDKDNPLALRYYVRVAKSRDGIDAPVINDGDIVASAIKESSFEIVTAEGKNVLKEITGNPDMTHFLYWDVWVTDGYDTVYSTMDIKDKNGNLRARYFNLKDLKDTVGRFTGTVLFQGLSSHAGAHVIMEYIPSDKTTESFIRDAYTDKAGLFNIDVPASDNPDKLACYKISVVDTSDLGYPSYKNDNPLCISDFQKLNTITLLDSMKPKILYTQILDTIYETEVTINGKYSDKGSQIKNLFAILDDKSVSVTGKTATSWSVKLSSLEDGDHLFKFAVQDSAGNVSDTLQKKFTVKATKLTLSVNTKTTAKIQSGAKFNFEASTEQASLKSITWKPLITGAKTASGTMTDKKSSLALTKEEFKTTFGVELKADSLYEMVAVTPKGVESNKVRFGFYSNGPVVYFESPSNDTTITINDKISLSLFALANHENPSYTLTWSCGSNISACPSGTELEKEVYWTKPGDYKISATIENAGHEKRTDAINVHVVSDPPAISLHAETGVIPIKINSNHAVEFTAKDAFGTVTSIQYKCGSEDYKTHTISAAKEINSTITLKMPSKEYATYKCEVKAIDDDGESSSAYISFNVNLEKPTVTLNQKSLTRAINDNISIFFTATDTKPGYIAKYESGCGSSTNDIENHWEEFSPSTSVSDGKQFTNVTLPNKASTYYCAIRVTDDDDQTATDYVTFTVILAPPTATISPKTQTVTINDELRFTASGSDTYKDNYGQTQSGSIVKFEWGCSKSNDINYTNEVNNLHDAFATQTFVAMMPDSPVSDYKCGIRFTDNDGNTATDIAHINVILAPPTVRINVDKTGKVYANGRINLSADAYDVDGTNGEIVKREWSCANYLNEIERNWKTVSTFDTAWVAPQTSAVSIFCVARATDDDGNTATDTLTRTYVTSGNMPKITVTTKSTYAVSGLRFDLDASINDKWDGVAWFSWQCFYKDTKQKAEEEKRYTYDPNGSKFFDYRENLSAKEKDLYCVISAEEKTTKTVFRDTTYVNIITQSQRPVGVITAADTIYPWSGDETEDPAAHYFFNSNWGGQNSKIGTIGNSNNMDFWWSFGTLPSAGFYQGLKTGKIDTNTTKEFHDAFIRPLNEGEFSVCLDFRDSTAAGATTETFLSRHRADQVCKTIYVRKAWKNLAGAGTTNDTVIEYNNRMKSPPAFTVAGKTPITAYTTGEKEIHTRYYNGSSWVSSIAAINTSANVKKLQMINNGTDAYLAVLTENNQINIYRSANGTSAWANVGAAISNATTVDLTWHTTNKVPVVSYINSSNNQPYYTYLANNAWKNATRIKDQQSSEVRGAVSSDGNLIFMYITNDFNYKVYYSIYDKSYANKADKKDASFSGSNLNLTTDGNTLYIGYMSQDAENMTSGDPYIRKSTIGANSLTWANTSGFNTAILPGISMSNISIAAKNGKVYVAFDDSWISSSAQVHVYYHNGTKWLAYGETYLPYFFKPFYDVNHYYLNGFAPTLSMSSDNKLHVSMLISESTHSVWSNEYSSWVASSDQGLIGQNFGPLVMRYVADNWTVK